VHVCSADIQPGQALLFETLTKTWRAKNCTLNSYGVTNTTYGLTPQPCKDCPTGTVANRSLSTSAPYYVVNADGSGGFMDEMSCVTKPGKREPCSRHITVFHTLSHVLTAAESRLH
jgi:hypothetical protein